MIVDIADAPRDMTVERIAELERILFAHGAWSRDLIASELDAPGRSYWLDVDPDAHARGRFDIRGYAGYWFDGCDAQIMTVGVAPDHRRRGIGRALLERLIDAARAQGAGRMLLEVRVDNEPALALYRDLGFTRMGLRRRYYQPEGVDAYTMSLELAPRVVGFQPSRREP